MSILDWADEHGEHIYPEPIGYDTKYYSLDISENIIYEFKATVYYYRNSSEEITFDEIFRKEYYDDGRLKTKIEVDESDIPSIIDAVEFELRNIL